MLSEIAAAGGMHKIIVEIALMFGWNGILLWAKCGEKRKVSAEA